MTSEGRRHELVRSSREPLTYDVLTDGRVTTRSAVSGRLLLDGAALQPVDGPGPWGLRPTRRVAPKTWELTDAVGSVVGQFSVGYLRRGGMRVELEDGPDDLRFVPDGNAVVDVVRAAVLADTGTFVLRHGTEVVATAARPRRRDRAAGNADAPRPRHVLEVASDASWRPSAMVAAALLVLRTHVVTEFRSP